MTPRESLLIAGNGEMHDTYKVMAAQELGIPYCDVTAAQREGIKRKMYIHMYSHYLFGISNESCAKSYDIMKSFHDAIAMATPDITCPYCSGAGHKWSTQVIRAIPDKNREIVRHTCDTCISCMGSGKLVVPKSTTITQTSSQNDLPKKVRDW